MEELFAKSIPRIGVNLGEKKSGLPRIKAPSTCHFWWFDERFRNKRFIEARKG